jgi:hypothetical protein
VLLIGLVLGRLTMGAGGDEPSTERDSGPARGRVCRNCRVKHDLAIVCSPMFAKAVDLTRAD